jgi:short-subunit dehydrogenase
MMIIMFDFEPVSHLLPHRRKPPCPPPRKSTPASALVTGASAGIGKAYAERLAARGFDLLLVARRGDRLAALAQTLRERHGVGVTTLVADLSQAADVERVAAALESDERITLLVNNAGIAAFASMAEADPARLATMTDVNVSALVRLSRAAIGVFVGRDRGTLVNIGSILGLHALPGGAGYSGTKGYVLNFTRGLQEEVAGTNVFVQLVMPAATATDIWETASRPLASLDPATVMQVGELVDAALVGLDLREPVTLPTVEDPQLLADYDTARLKLLAAAQRNRAASRYWFRSRPDPWAPRRGKAGTARSPRARPVRWGQRRVTSVPRTDHTRWART